MMILIFLFQLKTIPGWPLNTVNVTHSGPQALEHRCLAWLASPRPALQAIIDSRQSAHAGIPTVPEEWAMPVVTYSLAPPQRPPCAVLILLFRFISAAQLVLILVFFQKLIGSWELIADVTHLFFSNMLLLWLVFILGLFARSGLFPLLVTASHGSHHVNLERQVLALRSKIRQPHHVSLWEWLTVHLHRVLGQN